MVERHRIIIVEDHVAVRKGLQVLLSSSGMEVVGLAASLEHGRDVILAEKPDAAIVDLRLSDDDSGAELIRDVIRELPELGSIIYTGLDDADVLAGALDCGARGFVLKSSPARELVAAVVTVARGGSYVDQRLAPMLLSRPTTERIAELTPRERDVLALLADGLSGQDVADKLVIAPETVRTHIRNSMRKLEAHTRAHAIATALRQGHIE